jgi:hypothetical protein
MDKILEGELDRFHVPDLLTFLDMSRRTGVLVVERTEQESKLFLREGRPVFATSSRDTLKLGHVLVRQGKLPAETVERLLAQQRSGGMRMGQALVAERLMTEGELASILKVQVSEVIFETFEWKDGFFTFWDRVPPPAGAVTLEMELQSLIMEGVRRIDERGRISEVFPDLAWVVEAMANPERVKQSVTLTPDEWKVFFLIDGRRTLSEICRLAGNPDELATLQVLHNLLRANFVAVRPQRREEKAGTVDLGVQLNVNQPQSTVRVVEDGSPPSGPASGVSVAFAHPAATPRAEDDTREVVSPKAVHYLGEQHPRVTMSRLVLVSEQAETSFPLTRDSYTVGRHRNNDIVVSDPKVSSFHARIDRAAEGFVLVDLKSRNGCYVNGKRVESAPLNTNDEIRMGTARLMYKVDYTS